MKKITTIATIMMMSIMSLASTPAFSVSCSSLDANDPAQKQEAANLGCDSICLQHSGFNDEQKRAAGCDIDDPATESFATVRLVLNSVYFAATLAAVGTIIFGGFRYSVSQGDPGKVKRAKDTIMYAIIGLIVTLSAFGITNFILGIT